MLILQSREDTELVLKAQLEYRTRDKPRLPCARVQQSLGLSLSLMASAIPAGSSRLSLRFTSRERVAAAPPHLRDPAGFLVGLGLLVLLLRGVSCYLAGWLDRGLTFLPDYRRAQ